MAMGGGFNMGMASGIAGLAGQATQDILGIVNASGNVKEQAAGMIKSARQNMVGTQGTYDTLDALSSDISSYVPTSHVTKYDLGYKKFFANGGGLLGDSFGAAAQGGAAGAALGPWGMLGGAIGGQVTSLIKGAITNREAKKQAVKVNNAIDNVEAFNRTSFSNRAANIMSDNFSRLDNNYMAYGGSLGPMEYDLMQQNLDIKKLSAIGQNNSLVSLPNSFFVNDAKNGSYAFGGELNTQGGDFTNGLLHIDNGGSHEANPYEGVPLGVDPEGTPNLVEEGETVFNDYVFSKRLKVPKAIREKYKLKGTKGVTFAEASKKLAKESEERPNDPISMRGLEALMSDLASAQESVRETQQVRQHAMGGRLFKHGGDKGNQTLNYNNRTEGLYFGLDESQFNPYASDGTIDWDIMYGADSPYTKRRQYVIDHWDDPNVQEWLDRYVEGINEYNKGRAGYQPMSKSDITKDIFSNRTWDKSWGGMHAGIDYAGDPEKRIIEQHMLRNLKGDPIAMPDTDIYYPNTRGGYTWADRFSDRYTRANNGAYEETTDDDGNTVRTYYYDPIEKKNPVNRYFYNSGTKDNPNYVQYEGENGSLWMKNNGYFESSNNTNDQDGTDYYYDQNEEIEPGKYQDWLRYSPAVGFGIAAITDALGLTNKPDYSSADAILEATRGAGTYKPVGFNPIGNYLTYKPFDRNYYLNKMDAEAGATRRAIANTSGGNRATAMAGILAADNNYLNQIGGLARQAEEYNFAQRAQVEEFNRGTNTTNSQGFLQADIANQKALMDSREFSLKGTMAATEMRERARLASDAAKSANISGLFQTLGDIGFEEANKRMADKTIIYTGTPGGERLGYRITRAKGGKLKRKKGLTL